MPLKHNSGTVTVWSGKESGRTLGEDGKVTVEDIKEQLEEAIDDYTAAIQTVLTSVELLRQLLSRLQQVPSSTEPSASGSRMLWQHQSLPGSSTPTR